MPSGGESVDVRHLAYAGVTAGAIAEVDDPPRPIMVATPADEGAETSKVQREIELVDRRVAKVMEVRGPGNPRVLSLQHLDGVLDEILTESGVPGRTEGRLAVRLFLAFPLQFKWTRGKGLLPSQRWVLAKAPFARDQVPWLDPTITTGPDSAPVLTEDRADLPGIPAALPADADVAALRAHLHAISRCLRGGAGSGPRP